MQRIWMFVLGPVALMIFLAACGSPAQPIAAPDAPAATAVSDTVDQPKEASATPAAAALPDAQTFVVDTSASTASYGVDEVFLSENRPYHAVGTANSVTGSLEVVTNGKPAGRVTQMRVDLRTLTSDSARRDNAIRGRWLESDTYPYADFISTDALDLPDSYVAGTPVSFTLKGDLTVRGVTVPTSWQVTGSLTDGVITADATTKVTMSSFGFDAPNIAGMIRAEDGVTLNVHIVARVP